MKHALLPKWIIKRYNRNIRKVFIFITPAYCIGFILRGASFFLVGETGHVLALVSVPLQMPLVVHVFLGLRSEFVKVLLSYFDLWFQYAMLTTWVIVISFMLQDVRVVVVPVMWLEFSNALLVEASPIMSHRIFFVGTIVAALFMISLVVGVSINAIADAEYHELLTTPSHSFTTQDIAMNAMSTLAMFFIRLVYISAHSKKQHRWSNKRRERSDKTAMYCVHFRSVLKWQDVSKSLTGDVAIAPRLSTFTMGGSDSNVSTCSSTGSFSDHLQLTPVESTAEFESTATMIPWVAEYILQTKSRKMSRVLAILLLSTAAVGVAAMAVCLTNTPQAEFADTLSITALVATMAFTSVIFACYQRHLLRQVATTFNFIFLSIQISVAHLCLCDVFYWQTHKTFGVLSSWLWLHVVLTVDALTPVMKAGLSFRVWFVAPVVLLAIIGQVSLGVELVWGGDWGLQHRIVWETQLTAGKRLVFHSSSILLGRLVTLLAGLSRWLYVALRRQSDDELVLIQGAVEYDYTAWRKRVMRRAWS